MSAPIKRSRFDVRLATSLAGLLDNITPGNVTTGSLPDSVKKLPLAWTIPGDGQTDVTALVKARFEEGGEVYIPAGNYLIAAAGPDTGGVRCDLIKSLSVTCHPNARFFTNGVDNQMLYFQPGSQVPADGINFEWVGGIIDQRDQKVSQVVPFRTEFPPATGKSGTSNVTDGLYVNGSYTSGGTTRCGIKSCRISKLTTIGGDHWQNAGGDSGIFVEGCETIHVFKNRNIGNRDCGIYVSGTPSYNSHFNIYDNYAINCFHGSAVKRTTTTAKVYNNHSENCVRAVTIEQTGGNGHRRVEVSGNTGNKLSNGVRLQTVDGFSVHDNHFTSLGALLADGTTVVIAVLPAAFVCTGCTYGTISTNTFLDETAGIRAAFPSSERGLISVQAFTDGGANIASEFLTFVRNIGRNLRTAGSDGGANNAFLENVVHSAETSANLTVLGTNSSEVRINPTTNRRTVHTPILLTDGPSPSTAPMIARLSQTDVGLRLLVNTVSMHITGNNRVTANNTGVAFNNATPIAKPTLPAAATDAATTQALVNAIRTALIAYGLCD